MYEFKSVVDKDILSVMTGNWRTACAKIQANILGTLNFTQERRVITKNIYHKQPSKLPFTFVEVCIQSQ